MDKKTYYDKLLSDAFHFVNDINFDGAKMGIYKNGETKTYDFDKTNINEIKKVVNEFLKDVQNNYKTEETKSVNSDVKFVADCETCDNKEVCDALSQEYQYDSNKFDNVDITGEIHPTNSDSINIESSKNADSTNINASKKVDVIKNKTFILRSEISEDGPLYEVHMIDMLHNICDYFDFWGKYKSTLINIVNNSNEDILVEYKTSPWIFEASYLGTFSKYMLRKIEKYYKQGREVYLYNPVTSYVKCICDGETNIAGLPEFDIEDYGFRLETDVERALLNKSKR